MASPMALTTTEIGRTVQAEFRQNLPWFQGPVADEFVVRAAGPEMPAEMSSAAMHQP